MRMFFLQTDFTQRAFDTSPDTVYGLLVAALALAVLGLVGAVVFMFKKILEVTTSATTGMNATSERLEAMEDLLKKIKQ
jgi:CHASE3 domain sensor protein